MLVYDHRMFSSSRLFRMLTYCSLMRCVFPRNLQCTSDIDEDAGRRILEAQIYRSNTPFPIDPLLQTTAVRCEYSQWVARSHTLTKTSIVYSKFLWCYLVKTYCHVSEKLSCGGRLSLYCACIHVAHVPGALLCVRLWVSSQATSKT